MAERNVAQKSSEQSQSSQSSQSTAMQRRGAETSALGLNFPQMFLDPFSLFRSMFEDMNRMMTQVGRRDVAGAGTSVSAVWVPLIEVERRDGQFVVTAELPGVEEADINLEVADDSLIIRGERRLTHEEEEGGVRRSERMYGRFYRQIPLPEGVDANRAEARINNGVLEVSFPLTEQKGERKQIPVQSGGKQQPISETKERKAA
jgi:HSP20 family protein